MENLKDFFNPPPPPPQKKRTLDDVAKEAGISMPTIFRIRANPMRTTVGKLASLARVLGYDIAFVNRDDVTDVISLDSLISDA